MSGSSSQKAGSGAAPSEAELSRIAREAVHQPADPRLDRQLARLGATDAPEATEVKPGQATSRAIGSSAELERLDARIRRIELILVALVVAVAILAVLVAILLLR